MTPLLIFTKAALGHSAEHFREPAFLKHLLGGIRWVIGAGAG